MITPSEQRFRNLFHALDVQNQWNGYLTTAQLRYVRVAAETPETWLPFLAGVPCARHASLDQSRQHAGLSDEQIWNIAAIVRKRVTFAAIDEDFFSAPYDDREDDHGIMPGDDGGYTDYHHLIREENALRKDRTGVFRLLGYQGHDVTKIPKPLFGGRLRESLARIRRLCTGDAANSISEIVDIEARDGYVSVDDCLSAIDTFISRHGDMLGESSKLVDTIVTDVRREYEAFKSWFDEHNRKIRGMEGVLGVVMPSIGESDDSGSSGTRYDEELLEYRSDGGLPGVTLAKRPRVPIFCNAARRKSDGKSLWDMLGAGNAVVKNLGLYERVIKLKREMCRLQDKKDGKVVKEEAMEEVLEEKPKTDEIEIGEEASRGEEIVTRERAMGEAFVALLASHTGFTHVDERCLGVFTDVLEEFLGKIGKRLVSCRENIDNNAASVAATRGRERRKSKEELMMELEMVMEGVKGGFAELYNYVRADMMRTEQALKEVEIRLKERIKGLGGDGGGGGGGGDVVEEEIDGSEFVGEDDVVIDGEGLPFGYLGKRVWLDILGGVHVPSSLVFDRVKDEVQLMAIDS